MTHWSHKSHDLNLSLSNIFALLSFISFWITQVQAQNNQFMVHPIDPHANAATKKVFQFLHQLPTNQVLIGHEDALAYGVHWKKEPGRSDMKDVSGSHPAVFGWDISKIGDSPYNIDTVDFEQMKAWIIEAHDLGGINTISWHLDNPVSGGDSWDKTRAVHTILPGGQQHLWYLRKLDHFADFLQGLVSKKNPGEQIPILFRPFHEHTGSWFWWGRNHCTVEEYKALWKFTVEYLTQHKEIHQLLFVYAPDRVRRVRDYMERYPGDEYVDILGMDNYRDVGLFGNTRCLTKKLKMIIKLAKSHGKIAALTETGQERIPNRNWWTQVLQRRIIEDPVASQIAYVLVWRNANTGHFFGPFKGQRSAADFKRFTDHPNVLMLNDL